MGLLTCKHRPIVKDFEAVRGQGLERGSFHLCVKALDGVRPVLPIQPCAHDTGLPTLMPTTPTTAKTRPM